MPFDVVPSRRVVVTVTDTPNKLTTLIPAARTTTHKGKQVVVAPHDVLTTRLLRVAGLDVPSPILSYYDWPRARPEMTPFQAQLYTAAFMTYFDRGFILNDIGTGKTLSTLWAADYLMSLGLIRKVLVSSPLSTLERVWNDEIFTNMPHRSVAVLHGSKQRRLKLLNQPHDFYVINPDGLTVIEKELNDHPEIDLILIDEIALNFRNKTQCWEAMHNLLASGRKAFGMTGTPTPSSPTDAWAQVRLLRPERAPKYFSHFRRQVMDQLSEFVWQPKPTALQTVHNMMQPAVRFQRDECYDLPDVMYETLEVPLTPEQKKAYASMQKKLYAEYMEGTVTAANSAVKAGKLVQICAGILYDNDKQTLIFPHAPRMEALKQVLDMSTAKVIVFVPLTAALEIVAKELSKKWSVEIVHGDTSPKRRNEIFSSFQHTDTPHVLVAHPECMSHGLTLTSASTIVWYIPPRSTEVYIQANGRIQRAGQVNKQLIIHIQSAPIERKMYAKLQNNQSMQNMLLDMFD